MTNPEAFVLGALQGLTEVLPISSSAHLILVPEILGWKESGLTFDVALHLGTLIALSCYFWKDIIEMSLHFFTVLFSKRFSSFADKLPFIIILASVPAAIAGKTLEHVIEAMFRSNRLLIAIFMILFAILLSLSDNLGKKQLKMDGITFKSGLLIGIAQTLALIPGVSRSGITITAALSLGLTREAAARFSFLLSLPIVFGAALLKVGELVKSGVPQGEIAPLLIGVLSSAVIGYASVAFLLRFIRKSSLNIFVWYRLAAGAGVIAWLFLRN